MTEGIGSSVIQQDIYRVSKVELQGILTKFHIQYREDDTVADLRPIVADLKSYLKSNWTEEKKHLLRQLLSRRFLTETEREKYPSLRRIEQFLSERVNLYDDPAVDYELSGDEYEEIEFNVEKSSDTQSRNSQEGAHRDALTVTTSKIPSIAETIMSKEKLPLISAGTYHGLQSENPNDFIDKYEIAAMSNHWQENSKLNLFPAHLTGTALAWYQHYSKGKEINNWDNLKKVFIAAFSQIGQVQTLQNILENKIQGKDQPVLTYYLEILTLCRRYDPETTDKKIIRHIKQGLRPEFCERILGESCETLEELEGNLRKIELQLEIRAANREKYRRAESAGNCQDYLIGKSQELHNLQAEIKSLTQMVQSLSVQKLTPRNVQQCQHLTQQQAPRAPDTSMKRGNYYGGQNNFRQSFNQYRSQPRWNPRPVIQSYQPQHRSPWNPNRQTQYFRPQMQAFGSKNDRMYCDICRRNNHKTEECRFRRTQTGEMGQARARFCDYCHMNNHKREDCYRLKKAENNTKNV